MTTFIITIIAFAALVAMWFAFTTLPRSDEGDPLHDPFRTLEDEI